MDQQPSIIRTADLSHLVDASRIGAGRVSVLLLQHDDELDDSRLATLDHWSRADLDRIAKFRHQGARTSWCVSRLLVRRALAAACELDPDALDLCYGPQGKPYLANTSVRFNWSHTTGCVALAISAIREVGCDIEDSTRPSWDYLDVAAACFTPAELAWVTQPNDMTARWGRFLCLYVQKEARLKALGHGLSSPLRSVPVALEDPPFRDPSLRCFRYADRYTVAVCTTGIDAVSFEVFAQRLGEPGDWTRVESAD
jgi:phosphopantetheinyl transferase